MLTAGDFAVLLRAGMSAKQAILYNLLSSFLALIGMFIGLFVGNISSASTWIFPAIGGMFIYVALVDMVTTPIQHRSALSHVSVSDVKHTVYNHTFVVLYVKIVKFVYVLLGDGIFTLVWSYYSALHDCTSTCTSCTHVCMYICIKTLARRLMLYLQLPELTSLDPRSGEHPLVHFLLQNAGMLLGFGIMLVIALYETDIRLPEI